MWNSIIIHCFHLNEIQLGEQFEGDGSKEVKRLGYSDTYRKGCPRRRPSQWFDDEVAYDPVCYSVLLFFSLSLSLGQFLSHQCYTWGSVLGTRLTLPFDHCYFSSTWARRDRLPFSAWLEREPSRLSNSSNTEYYVESWISQNFFASFALLRILHYPLAFPNYPVWINVWVEEMVS